MTDGAAVKRVLMGVTVRDPRSGLVGRVIGIVDWENQAASLVVQPPVRPDATVPPTQYVPEPIAEVIPQPTESTLLQ